MEVTRKSPFQVTLNFDDDHSCIVITWFCGDKGLEVGVTKTLCSFLPRTIYIKVVIKKGRGERFRAIEKNYEKFEIPASPNAWGRGRVLTGLVLSDMKPFDHFLEIKSTIDTNERGVLNVARIYLPLLTKDTLNYLKQKYATGKMRMQVLFEELHLRDVFNIFYPLYAKVLIPMYEK